MAPFRKACMDYIRVGTECPVFPERLPVEMDDVEKAVTVTLISDFSGHVHQGPSGLLEQRVQVDVYGKDFDTVDLLAEQVRGLMDGYRGPWGDDITVGHCLLDNEMDGDAVSTRLARRIQDYLVGYNAAVGS